jgi:hypothetical protein
MMIDRLFLRQRSLKTLVLLHFALIVAGCGPGFKVVPVTGKIFVNGEPLPAADATVVFRPDSAKGNTINLDFSGTTDENGNYSLYYGGKGNRGAAPGWYKVAVVATEPLQFPTGPPGPDKRKRPTPGPPVRKTLIDRKYTVPTSSGIEIEVVENPGPGAYDLKLSGPAKN